ncbi:MAG: SDR family NAD(P)-dependent oxidoreductase [Hyphomicrobiales bacterium]|nr:SDR family NAD(P)-dependent oxidoreductase [Hyphomicrobiales bacterium]OQW84316.1 MAG: 3-oxoacyl-ACP reductase [Proteobacteria bacterium ST_bin15]
MSIRFDQRVAIVTGAGNGLGRAHALGLAARGAKVVVNDLGGALDGSGSSARAAERVVDEISAAGGEAFADAGNVADAAAVEAMIATTLSRYGRVDILINNAGILRDKSFAKMEMSDFRAVMDVHVMGAVHCTKAVWETMRTQNYGRILFTTSSSGLYGNFGQANYAAAKAALIGLMNTLHLEGEKYNIRLNALAPVAATRMTQELMPKEALGLLKPEAVTPGVLFLMSENAPSRVILAAGAGGFAVTHIIESEGLQLPGDPVTPEAIAAAFADISDAGNGKALQGAFEQTAKFVTRALAAAPKS